MSRFQLLRTLFGLLTLFLLSDAACAEERDYLIGSDAERAADERIERALATIVEVNFKQQKLTEVIKSLSAAAKIEIVIEPKELEVANLSPDTKITCQVRPVALHSALRRLLRPLELFYHEHDGGLFITTSGVDIDQIQVRVYPVADLIGNPEPLNAPDADKKHSIDDRGGPSAYDALIRVITTTFDPTGWDEVGGAGTIQPFEPAGALVIAQRRDVHRGIRELLATLRVLRQAQNLVPPNERATPPTLAPTTKIKP